MSRKVVPYKKANRKVVEMFFHKVKSSKVLLKPYRTKRSLIINISGYAGKGYINSQAINHVDNSIVIIPKGALIECDLTKEEKIVN
ncbi:hypothetical protein [Vibrio rotiferianus]|uniref:hypothetical protein n=1 Tax=Vibrio rotiferianus TaxID=190895 RepID=UPI00406A12F0